MADKDLNFTSKFYIVAVKQIIIFMNYFVPLPHTRPL